MCGIAGFVSFINKKKQINIKNCLNYLAHRGPDGQGIWNSENPEVLLLHTRLAIIDTSPGGAQPMISPSNRFVITYNGEIYNFKEIKSKYGFETRTNSDTEVILHLFEKKGIECLNELEGMYAFAIWDTQERCLYLVRDHAGIKPLYYYYDGFNIFFASEINALLCLLGYKPAFNFISLIYYLHLGFVSEPHTFYNGIYAIKAGHYIKVNASSFKIESYWKPKLFTKKIYPPPSEIEEIIKEGVSLSLTADVPISLMFSGGTDSSIVALMLKKIGRNDIEAFSISFPDPKYDETKWATKVASHLNMPLTIFKCDTPDADSLVKTLIDTYHQPHIDTSLIPFLFLSKQIAQKYKVALTGDGGDELFYGYGNFIWAKRINSLSLFLIYLILARIPDKFLTRQLTKLKKMFSYTLSFSPLTFHIHSVEQEIFTGIEISKLLSRSFPILSIKLDEEIYCPYEAMFYFNYNEWLRSDMLVKADRASMKYSLEVRPPLLTKKIIEYATRLPDSYKIKKGISKYILKKILEKYLPQEIIYRKKWGFALPYSLPPGLVQYYLFSEEMNKHKLFNRFELQKLFDAFIKNESANQKKILAVVVFNYWYWKNYGS